ncbi:MAG: glycogen operon protein, partial [Paracoccaceae bacterium]
MKQPELTSGTSSKLGAVHDGEGVNFAVFSKNATGIDLCLFSPDGRTETARLPMPERTGAVWHGYV